MQVYIVTGGYGPIGSANFLDSTEIYNSNLGSWNYGARLPKAMQSLRGTNIDGRILIFGKMKMILQRLLLSDYKSKICSESSE